MERDTFIKLPMDNKMDVVFDLLGENKQDHNTIKADIIKCNFEITKRKRIDTATAGVLGFFGGLVGFCSQKLFFK